MHESWWFWSEEIRFSSIFLLNLLCSWSPSPNKEDLFSLYQLRDYLIRTEWKQSTLGYILAKTSFIFEAFASVCLFSTLHIIFRSTKPRLVSLTNRIKSISKNNRKLQSQKKLFLRFSFKIKIYPIKQTILEFPLSFNECRVECWTIYFNHFFIKKNKERMLLSIKH